MRTTKVILLENIPKLGDKGEIKTVKSGYARNFLFPSKKVMPATPKNLKTAKKLQAQAKVEAEKQKKAVEEQGKKLEGATFEIFHLANQEGQLYAAVTEKQIADIILEKTKIEFEPEQIEFASAIKKLGDYEVTVDLGFSKKAKINLKVCEKKEK